MQEWKLPTLGEPRDVYPSRLFQYVFDPGIYQARLNVPSSECVCVCVCAKPTSVAGTGRLTPASFGCFHCPGVSIIKRRRMYAVEDEREVVMFVIRHPDIAPTPHGPVKGTRCNCRPRQHRLGFLAHSAPEIFLAVFAAAVVGLWLWILPTRPLVLRTPAGSLPLG